MTRQKLPNRRESMTFTVLHPGDFTMKPVFYDVMVGFPAGVLAGGAREVFVSCNKVSTALHTAGLDIATLISIALQYGATLPELAAAMTRGDQGEPQGVAGAVLDAVIAEMGV